MRLALGIVLILLLPMAGAQLIDLTRDDPDTIFLGKVESIALGDVDGDGKQDLLISREKESLLFFGDNVLPFIVKDTFDARFTHDAAAESVLADLNGDGLDDVAFGFPHLNVGSVLLTSLPFPVEKSATSGVSLFGPKGKFGTAMATGDINGDGILDLVASAPLAETKNRLEAGIVYIYYGRSNFYGTPDVVLNGPETKAHIGADIAIADINQDGYADMVLGGNKVRIVWGKTYFAADYDLDDDTTMTTIEGATAAGFGTVVAAGDVNSNCRPDVAIADHGTGQVFMVYDDRLLKGRTINLGVENADAVVKGSAQTVQLADVDNDNVADVLVGVGGEVHIYFGGKDPDTNRDWLVEGTHRSFAEQLVVGLMSDMGNDIIIGASGAGFVGNANVGTVSLLTEPVPLAKNILVCGGLDNDGDGVPDNIDCGPLNEAITAHKESNRCTGQKTFVAETGSKDIAGQAYKKVFDNTSLSVGLVFFLLLVSFLFFGSKGVILGKKK